MLGWLRTYLERRRRRAVRAAKMAAESAELVAMLHPGTPKRGSRKKKWFGLVSDNSRRSAPVAMPKHPSPGPAASQPAALPSAVSRPAAPPPPMAVPAMPVAAAPGAAQFAVAAADSGLATVRDEPAPAMPERGEPEVYGPPPPPARPVHAAARQPPLLDAPVEMLAEPAVMATAGVMATPAVMATPIMVAAPTANPRGGWLLASFGWGLRTAAIVALIGATAALMGWPVWRESRRIDVEIMPIAVPAGLAARGFSPEVAAGRLLDALDAIAVKTIDNDRNRPSKDDLGPIPAISAVSERTTLRSLASLLRDLRGLPTRRIAGEVTVSADGHIAVRLRVPGGGQIAMAEGGAGEDADKVFAAAAPEIWRRLNPLIYAWHVADSGGSEEVIRPKLVALAQELRLPPPVEFRVSVLYARSLVRSGRAEEALVTIEGLERRGAAYPLLWNVKAQALADLGRTEAALDAQKQAVAAEGTSVWSHISSAHLLMKLGKPREALTDLQSARRLAPNNFDAVLLESMVLLSIDRPPEALALIGRVIDARPNLPGVQEALGNALLANRRPDEAIAAFDAEIARNPAGASVRLSRANALRALRRPEEALETIDAILRLSPRDGIAIALRGWTLLDLGRADQALALFELLLKEKSDDVPSLHGRGMALATLGRRPEAIGALSRVLEVQPANRRVAADLARLRGAPPPSAPAARP